MNIVLTELQYEADSIYFMEPIVNTIMENSVFIKVIYSNPIIILNGLYLQLDLKLISSEIYFKKVKYTYDVNNDYNKNMLNKIFNIENSILDKYSTNSFIKKKKNIIWDTLITGAIKLYPNTMYNETNDCNAIVNTIPKSVSKLNTPNVFILKISGIWENTNEYGLTYKIIQS
jgi:hypothetical protein